MNKKQLVTVWVGVALISILVCYRMYRLYWMLYERSLRDPGFEVPWSSLLYGWDLPFLVAALTVGLTCTFADKKPKDEQKQ
jgi:hypothetical protein